MLNQLQHLYQALKQAKAESDTLVAEGRRITGWPKPMSIRQKLQKILAQKSAPQSPILHS